METITLWVIATILGIFFIVGLLRNEIVEYVNFYILVLRCFVVIMVIIVLLELGGRG